LPYYSTLSIYLRISSSSFGSETISTVEAFTAVSGSFKPLPVSTATTWLPFGIEPFSTDWITPAIEAAEPGSANTPSFAAI